MDEHLFSDPAVTEGDQPGLEDSFPLISPDGGNQKEVSLSLSCQDVERLLFYQNFGAQVRVDEQTINLRGMQERVVPCPSQVQCQRAGQPVHI
ncbi:MAG: hypothetical protein ACE5IZ_09575 [Dehalococcoidia bacterium]